MLAAVAVAGIAITTQSLWIDEGLTAYKAIQPTLGAWWEALTWERNSNIQLPFYLLYVWGWEKVFGSSELALRAANIPPFLVCVAALRYTFHKAGAVYLWALLLLLSSPFIWFYLNEARPYIFLLASSSFLFGAIYRLSETQDIPDIPTSWFVVFAVSALAVTATSMLASLWVIFSFAAAWSLRGADFPLVFVRRAPVTFAFMVFGGASLAAYYLWSLQTGLRLPRFGQQIMISLFHSAYELLGFAGLGPSRLALRDSGLKALLPYAFSIGPLALCWGLLMSLPLVSHATRRFLTGRKFLAILLLLLPAALVFALGYFEGIRISPRYLTPAFPMVMACAAGGLALLWRRPAARVLVILFFALTLFSALQIRFAPRHTKEDYREAATLAAAHVAQGRTICWAADVQTAIYYGLVKEVERDTGSRQVVLSQRLGEKPVPSECTVVILSRLDVHDRTGKIRRFIQANGLREETVLTGFWIYVAAPGKAETPS